jgi:magnesium-transporting ATPase (P-type)
MTNKKFKYKNFTSFTLLFSLLILILSGIAMYIRPEGSIANWVGWSFMGLSKNAWEGMHTLFCIFFIIFVILHLFFNWKIVMNYLNGKLSKGLNSKKEFFSAVVLVSIFLITAVMQWPPLWKIPAWRADIKKGNNIITVRPPESEFEKKKLLEVASILNLSIEELVQKMINLNLVVDTDNPQNTTLLEIARSNKTTPEIIYIQLINNSSL